MQLSVLEKSVKADSSVDDKKRILLVNPPSGFLIDQRVFLPIGIASIAAVAKERGNHVDLMDLADVEDYAGEVAKRVATGNYDAVGVTATSPQFFYAHRILEAVKKTNPSIKTIIGGSHASMFSSLRDSLIKRFEARGYSRDEAEKNIYEEDPNFKTLENFDVIASGEENSLLAALAFDNGKWVNGGVTENLDKLPLPARDMFDFHSYLFDPQGSPKFKINSKPSGSLISQRGCPYQCEFCCGRDSKMYHQVKLPGGVLRAHSPERIVQELDEMNREFGLESFMFYDDEFNLHPERTKLLCDSLKERNYKFRGFIKSDLFVKHPEVAGAMKDAGFVEVLTGVESGSERILSKHLHKKTSPELNYRAAMLCLENGIDFKALTMLGHTSETPRDVMDTRDWLLRTGKEFYEKVGPGHFTFDLTVFQPYAGCPIWDRAERNPEKEFSDYEWAYYTRSRNEIVDQQYGGIYFNKVDFSKEQGFYKGIPGTYKAFIRTKTVSAEQLVSLRDSIEWEIRDRLNMAQLSAVASQFDHSMGQGSQNKPN
jgi:anaerobic magnesium-protoporphyrin IX monomethyl ester cyclase